MPDVGSPLLDVVIALAFIYFLMSLICSGLMEAVASRLKLRSKDLEAALREMLADGENDETADAVLDHPQVKQLSTKKLAVRKREVERTQTPSYISSRAFGLALLDTIAPPGDNAGSRNVLADIRDKTKELPPRLRRQIEPMLDSAGEDIAEFRKSVEDWFDDSMDRVSTWYKQRSQLIILGFAVVVTVAMNVSTFRIVDRLWNDSTVREVVVAAGVSAAQAEEGDAAPEASGEEAKAATKELASLNLPIGWGDDNDDWLSFLSIGGWLITIGAIWLGAPFWFQLLSRLTPLRNTGPPPDAGHRRR